jgi:hypothetical protein
MWKLKPDERLARWREFRKKLDSLTLDDAVQEVAQFWTGAPFTPYYLDIDRPEEWPDPWTLVEENYWCDVAIAMGMLYTIKFTAHDPEIKPHVYYDTDSQVYYNLAFIEDGKYVLNMSEGKVVNKTQIKNNLELLYCYGEQELKLNSY